MKKLGLSISLALVCISLVWAGDEPPTVESNKHLIDVVQSHADYVWTLVAAALVFFMQAHYHRLHRPRMDERRWSEFYVFDKLLRLPLNCRAVIQ